jgi:hypothetical protein
MAILQAVVFAFSIACSVIGLAQANPIGSPAPSFGINGHPLSDPADYPSSSYQTMFQVMRANGLRRLRVDVPLASFCAEKGLI